MKKYLIRVTSFIFLEFVWLFIIVCLIKILFRPGSNIDNAILFFNYSLLLSVVASLIIDQYLKLYLKSKYEK